MFNFVLKSGTNQVHGSALGFIHNEWMDANSFVNNYYGKPRQRDRRHDWGGSIGGPVYLPKIYDGKDKTFFYVAYERYKESYAGGGSPTVTVPLDEFWSGNLGKLLTSQVIGQDGLGRNVYQGAISTQLSRPDVVAIIQARDSAGNVSVQSLKGTLSDAFSVVNLPAIMR